MCVLKGTPRNVVNKNEPSYSLVSSEIVVPDQSEVDEVDERALKKEQAELNVNKDDEIVTEVVQGMSSIVKRT